MLLVLCVRSSQLIVPEGLWGGLFLFDLNNFSLFIIPDSVLLCSSDLFTVSISGCLNKSQVSQLIFLVSRLQFFSLIGYFSRPVK